MKLVQKLSLMIGIITLASSVVWSTDWNSIVTTSATLDPASGSCVQSYYAEMDLFANANGLHLLVKDDDGIKYRRYSTSGTVQSTTNISSSGEFPNIIGNDDDLYLAYFDDDSLFVKKSTNNGDN